MNTLISLWLLEEVLVVITSWLVRDGMNSLGPNITQSTSLRSFTPEFLLEKCRNILSTAVIVLHSRRWFYHKEVGGWLDKTLRGGWTKKFFWNSGQWNGDPTTWINTSAYWKKSKSGRSLIIHSCNALWPILCWTNTKYPP